MANKASATTATENLGGTPQDPASLEATTETGPDKAPAPQENLSHSSDEAIKSKIDSVARSIMESINPSFFEKQRDLLKDDPHGPEPISPAITTLFHSASEAVQIFRVLGIGSCKFKLPKDGHEDRKTKGEVRPNPYLMWSRGSSTPLADRNVPIICIVSRDKTDERVATFTLP